MPSALRSRQAVIGAVLGATLGVGVLVSMKPSTASTTEDPDPLATVRTCASVPVQLQPSPNTERNTVLNTQDGLLAIEYSIEGINFSYVIEYTRDPTCQVLPAFRSLIDHALLVDRQNTQEQCPSLREAFQSGVTELRSVPINREALGRYLEEYC